MKQAKWLCAVMVVLWGTTALVGCSTLTGHKKAAQAQAPAGTDVAAVAPTQDDLESQLRRVAAGDIGVVSKDKASEVQRCRPYYFREYFEYPLPDDLKVSIEEKESKVAPYEAEVTVPKVRFATKLHRSREEAAADQKYFRGTGNETLTYEFRNGRWVRSGSLFVANRVEENVNGEWVPVVEELQSTIAKEDETSKGWFSRTWSSIVGR